MRVVVAGSREDPLVVLQSSFWAFNAIGVFDGGEALVVDPGIEPAEIDALRAALAGHGAHVTKVVLTHSHHDHVRGWMRFPGAEVHMPAVAAAKGETARARILAAKRAIDARLGVDDPGFRYPEPTHVFAERAELAVGGLAVELRFLPGHSDCTSVVWIPSLGTLCTADYLVSPGLPYCRWRAREFEAALATMAGWVDAKEIERVLPAHREPLLGRAAIHAALARERDYFHALRAAVRDARAAGLAGEPAARRAAERIAAWRGADIGRRAVQDIDNAQRVLAEVTPADRGPLLP